MSGLPKFRCGYSGNGTDYMRHEVGFKDMFTYVQHVLILRLHCCSYNEQCVCFYGVAAGCCPCSSVELVTVLRQQLDTTRSYPKKIQSYMLQLYKWSVARGIVQINKSPPGPDHRHVQCQTFMV